MFKGCIEQKFYEGGLAWNYTMILTNITLPMN